MTGTNPMSTSVPWTMVAEGYEIETKPLFEQFCREALRLSDFASGGKVLDVACGPGTLSLLIHQQAEQIDAIDFSQGMLDCFARQIRQQGITNIRAQLMDGQALGFPDNAFDRAYSIFGLMFFPDRIKGFRELYRTLKPGGKAAVTSWAPVSDSPLMQLLFGAMGAAFPKKPETNSNAVLTLEDPDNFKQEMERAGFSNVSVTHFDGGWTITDVETFFDAMVRGSAPIVMLKEQLGEAVWQEKRAVMLAYLREQITELPVTPYSRAYIGVGEKAG
ncbi:MAG: methyltransferase domain-containing protein [Gammaproteobacteria bacterium]|nr:methyltransferase domain-containing protein [Gammaproteobacteria bacterium]